MTGFSLTLASFTTSPILENPIITRKHISKKDIFERTVGRLRNEFKLVEEQKKDLSLSIYRGTDTHHNMYWLRLCWNKTCFLCWQILSRQLFPYRRVSCSNLCFGYNIAPEVWLGTKDFTEYDGDEEGVVNNILSEIETIKQKIWPISNLY